MRRFVFYGALAATAIVVAVSCSSSTEEVRSAAQPPDNPGDTAPGQPTTTTEPEPGPTVQQVEIKGRFGKACSDEGLCLETLPPNAEICHDGHCEYVELLSDGQSPVVMRTEISFQGETLTGQILHACDLGPHEALTASGGMRTSEDGHGFFFFSTLPPGTPPLELDGIPIAAQVEIHSAGLLPVQIVVTDYLDLGTLDTTDTSQLESANDRVFDLLQSRSPTDEELAARFGASEPVGCTPTDIFSPDEIAELPGMAEAIEGSGQ